MIPLGEARSDSTVSRSPPIPMAVLAVFAKPPEQTTLRAYSSPATESISRPLKALAKADRHWN